jgi:molybdate transport system substrate-binding protein
MLRFLAASAFALATTFAFAADLQVLSAGAVEPGLVAAVADFTRQTGQTVTISFATAPMQRKKIAGGETPDLFVSSAAVVKELDGQGRFVAGTVAPVGRVGVGVTVRAGAPAPDISSVDALKRSLLAADSLVYNEASTGIYFHGLLQRLGLADEVKAKTKRYPNGEAVMEHVIHGKGAEIGIGAATEIMMFVPKGLRYVGPLPAEVQNYTTYSVAAMAASKNAEAAKALAAYLAGAEARKTFAAHGID